MAKPTIAELEAILQNEEEVPIEILSKWRGQSEGADLFAGTGRPQAAYHA